MHIYHSTTHGLGINERNHTTNDVMFENNVNNQQATQSLDPVTHLITQPNAISNKESI